MAIFGVGSPKWLALVVTARSPRSPLRRWAALVWDFEQAAHAIVLTRDCPRAAVPHA